MKKLKVLILGATGMFGHVLYTYLEELNIFELFNTVYRTKLNEKSELLDVTNIKEVEKTIMRINPNIIINCIGVLIKGANLDSSNAIYINSYLPHQLSKLAKEIDGKLIHISTDCVFSGKKGSYIEDDIKDAEDVYGKSKALGEIINDSDITIRTSIIGPEIKENGEGLMHWVFNQTNQIYGYEKAIWGGVTTLELAKAIKVVIDNNLTGLYQLTNNKKINKFNLLTLIKETWMLEDLEISKTDGKKVDKSLINTRKNMHIIVPDYKNMLEELRQFMIKHSHMYTHYKLKINN